MTPLLKDTRSFKPNQFAYFPADFNHTFLLTSRKYDSVINERYVHYQWKAFAHGFWKKFSGKHLFKCVASFRLTKKSSRRFQTVWIFLDMLKTFRTVQNCLDLSGWLQNLPDSCKTVRIFPDGLITFRTAQNCPDLSNWLENPADGFKTVPKKILQNAVQTHWSQVNRTLQSKVKTISIFGPTAPL